VKPKYLYAALFVSASSWMASASVATPEAAQPDLEKTYADAARRIRETALRERGAWDKLEILCDDIGHRFSGSPQLEQAAAWAAKTLRADGHENVRLERVMVPKWVRGRESLEMVAPRSATMSLLGLGGSIGTPAEGITASVLVVKGKKELLAAGDKARGRIVLFNNAMPPYDPEKGSGYGTAVRFRHKGAALAAAQGAVACLVRSVTARSLRSPHTGAMSYDNVVSRIPAAAVTIEDAEMIARLAARGHNVRLTLKMQARDEGLVPSSNVLGELRGSSLPEEFVVIGGHLDSWDVGQGAHDDGAGCVMAMEALTVLRKLNLRPRRTIRVVLWVNEENGLAGGKQYAKEHAEEKHVAAIESDSGGFHPRGYSLECKDKARQDAAVRQLEAMTALLAPLGATRVVAGHSGADVSPLKDSGAVLMGLDVEGSKYFDYHHTHADTLDKVDPQELQECVAAMATVAYIIADMPEPLGR